MKPTLPTHRLPCDAYGPQRLWRGCSILDRTQTVEEALEVAAYLEAYLIMVDPDQGNDRRTQVYHSKGQRN